MMKRILEAPFRMTGALVDAAVRGGQALTANFWVIFVLGGGAIGYAVYYFFGKS